MTPVCTESFVGWGFAPDPTGGAYSAPPDSLAVFRGLKGGRGGEGRGREGRREREFVLCHRKKKEKLASYTALVVDSDAGGRTQKDAYDECRFAVNGDFFTA